MKPQQKQDCEKQLEQERRIDRLLYAYWLSLLGDTALPSEKDIDPREIQNIWDHCFLLEVCDRKNSACYYQYLGKSLMARGILDQPAYEVYDRLLCVDHLHMRHQVQKLVGCGSPLTIGQSLKSYDGIMKIHYRGCLLPLSANGRELTHVIGGLNWKAI